MLYSRGVICKLLKTLTGNCRNVWLVRSKTCATFHHVDVEPKCTVKLSGDIANFTINGDPAYDKLISIKNASSTEDLKVELSDKNVLNITSSNSTEFNDFEVTVPINTDLVASVISGNLTVRNLQTQMLEIELKNGNITLDDTKANMVKAHVTNGSIISPATIHGDVDFNCKNGMINIKKVLGNEIHLDSGGEISVGDLYANDIYITTEAGDICANSIHGITQIIVNDEGNINLSAVEGELDVTCSKGNFSAFLPLEIKAFISANEGDVFLKFSENAAAKLDMESQNCFCDEESLSLKSQPMGPCNRYKAVLNDGSMLIRVIAPQGNVSIQTISWFESLKLRKKE